MARSASECFKDKGFLMKFIELILIIVCTAIWYIFFYGQGWPSMFFDAASVLVLGSFYNFFPVLCMFVIYILEGFPDKLYELIITIGGACMSGLAGIFYLLAAFIRSDSKYEERYRHSADSGTMNNPSHPSDKEFNYILLSIFMFALMVAYILDAIMNGAGKQITGIND